MTIDIKALNRLLDEIDPAIAKGAQFEAPAPAAEPVVTKTVGDGLAQPYGDAYDFLSSGDSLFLQRRLNKLSWEEKGFLLQTQLQKGAGSGMPIQAWQMANMQQLAGQNPAVAKALDTAGGAALIRTDLDPFLVSMFVSIFPAWQRINKVPANGLIHSWDQLTAYASDTSTSAFISELGTVVDKTGTYTRANTNIAVYGQRRGVSFKQQLAVQAGGMSWDSARLEIQNGLTQMAHDIQKTIFQGQSANSGGTASNELGLYDANAFTGLRALLNDDVTGSATAAVDFSPYLTTGATNFVTAFNSGITNVANQVGVTPSVVYSRYDELGQLSNQQLSIQRTMDEVEFIPGVQVPAVMTSLGKLPIVGVPGDAIGTYSSTVFTGGTKTVADLYMINEQELQIPYLGSPGPSVIEIPPGVSGQLSRLYIVWGMFGLALLSNLHSVKLRANQATS
jgi:hypothetical protein